MCGSTVDIQSVTAEKRRGKKALKQVGLYVRLQLNGDLDFMTVLSFCVRPSSQ